MSVEAPIAPTTEVTDLRLVPTMDTVNAPWEAPKAGDAVEGLNAPGALATEQDATDNSDRFMARVAYRTAEIMENMGDKLAASRTPREVLSDVAVKAKEAAANSAEKSGETYAATKQKLKGVGEKITSGLVSTKESVGNKLSNGKERTKESIAEAKKSVKEKAEAAVASKNARKAKRADNREARKNERANNKNANKLAKVKSKLGDTSDVPEDATEQDLKDLLEAKQKELAEKKVADAVKKDAAAEKRKIQRKEARTQRIEAGKERLVNGKNHAKSVGKFALKGMIAVPIGLTVAGVEAAKVVGKTTKQAGSVAGRGVAGAMRSTAEAAGTAATKTKEYSSAKVQSAVEKVKASTDIAVGEVQRLRLARLVGQADKEAVKFDKINRKIENFDKNKVYAGKDVDEIGERQEVTPIDQVNFTA